MFGMGSNAELTRKYERVKVQNNIRTSKHIYINKQASPIFNCFTPESVSLASLARQSLTTVSQTRLFTWRKGLQHSVSIYSRIWKKYEARLCFSCSYCGFLYLVFFNCMQCNYKHKTFFCCQVAKVAQLLLILEQKNVRKCQLFLNCSAQK